MGGFTKNKKWVLDTLGKTYQTEDCPGRGVNLGSFRFRWCSLPMQRLRPHGYCACSFWFSPPLMPKSLKKDNFFLLGWRFWWILECLSPRSRPSRTMLFFLPVDFCVVTRLVMRTFIVVVVAVVVVVVPVAVIFTLDVLVLWLRVQELFANSSIIGTIQEVYICSLKCDYFITHLLSLVMRNFLLMYGIES